MQILIQQVQGEACDSQFRTGPWVMLTLGSTLHFEASPISMQLPHPPQWTPWHRKDFFSVVLFLYYLWLCWAFVVAWTFLWRRGLLSVAVCRLLVASLAAEAQALGHRLQ